MTSTVESAEGDASAEVVVPLATATKGLPAICAITGGTADGAIPLRVGRSITKWKAPVVRMPMSEAIFTRWSRRKGIHIKARAIASVLTAIAVVLTFRSPTVGLSVLAVAIAAHLVDLWAARTSSAVEPRLERQGHDVRISRVHRAFADAVAQTVR